MLNLLLGTDALPALVGPLQKERLKTNRQLLMTAGIGRPKQINGFKRNFEIELVGTFMLLTAWHIGLSLLQTREDLRALPFGVLFRAEERLIYLHENKAADFNVRNSAKHR